MCLGGSGFLSQASVDFSTGHLCSLKSSFYSWAILILWVCASVCVCMHVRGFFFFSFNLCLSCFECWNLGGVFFRKPSLANIHDHSLLLLLTHCLHFLPFCVCLPCARPRPWEMSLLAEPADGEHGFRWWGSFLTQLALFMWVTCIARNTEVSCSWDLKTAILSDWASVSLAGFGWEFALTSQWFPRLEDDTETACLKGIWMFFFSYLES